MIKIRVLFFATIKERAGVKEVEIEIAEGTDIASLKQILADRFPTISSSLDTVIVSINREFAFDGDQIPEDAEIAIFPPVSGGVQSNAESLTIVKITKDVITYEELIAQLIAPTTGAACVFSGFVRGKTMREEERETIYLEYDAYHEMAESMMKKVAEEIRERWPHIIGIGIIQRIGRLDAGTPTVMIACTAAHRDTGIFDATRYGIDRLKEIVPIWKKEVGPKGEFWVEGDYVPSPDD